jgi:hypothetical protein
VQDTLYFDYRTPVFERIAIMCQDMLDKLLKSASSVMDDARHAMAANV